MKMVEDMKMAEVQKSSKIWKWSKYRKGRRYENGRSTEKVELMRTLTKATQYIWIFLNIFLKLWHRKNEIVAQIA